MADELEALRRETRRLRAENRRLRAENRELRVENERLARRVAALEARVTELTQRLEEAQRAGKRQAAPFSRGEPTEDPKPPGRPPGHPGTYRLAPEIECFPRMNRKSELNTDRMAGDPARDLGRAPSTHGGFLFHGLLAP